MEFVRLLWFCGVIFGSSISAFVFCWVVAICRGGIIYIFGGFRISWFWGLVWFACVILAVLRGFWCDCGFDFGCFG